MLGVCSLFIPASAPRMINAGLSLPADSLILDLEDAVSPTEKDSARELLRHALPLLAGRTVAVRINGADGCWQEDLELFRHPGADVVVAPKAAADFLARVGDRLDAFGSPARVAALVETAAGVEDLPAIARSCGRLTSLLFGGEDYSLDLGVSRTPEGEEIRYARARISNTAHAHGLEALDTPFVVTNDDAALEQDARRARNLGFTGKLAINPNQVPIIRRAFAPSRKELDWAERVVRAAEDPANRGKGAIALDGKMIDEPIVKRARLMLSRRNAQEWWA